MTVDHLMIAVIVLQVLDVLTTLYVLRKKAGVETNPIMRKLMDTFGPELGLIAPKVIATFPLWAFRDQTPLWVWLVVIVVFALVVINNLKYVMKARA